MKKRVSKFELIRIIAMYLIVLHHSMIHGMLSMQSKQILDYPWQSAVGYILGSGGKVGVYLFVLITGYFMINSTISIKKLFKIWLPIFFWSIVLFVVFGCIVYHEFSIKNLIKAMFPIVFNQYWFMTVYVVMYLLIPMINEVVEWIIKNNKIKYFLLVGLVLIFGNSKQLFGGPSQVGAMLIVFIIIYCTGAIIKKKEGILINCSKSAYCLGFITLIIVNVMLEIGLVFVYKRTDIHIAYKLLGLIFGRPFALFNIVEAVLLFLIIAESNFKYHKLVNYVSSVTFGVYIISDNTYTSSFIWNNVFHMKDLIDSNPFVIIITALMVSVIVFIICGLLEALRSEIFNKLKLFLEINVQKLIKK